MYEITITTNQIKGAALTLTLVLLVLVSVLNVFAANNTTNNTTTNNSNQSVKPMSIIASVDVTPTTVNLGTLMPDGIEHSYPSAATVTVSAFNLFTTTNLYVSASGAFVNTANSSNTIPLTNFKYDNPRTGSKTSFTTGSTLIGSWSDIVVGGETVHMNYYLTVPPYTGNGTYTTTITYSVT